MSDVIDFIERLGQDSALRDRLTQGALEAARHGDWKSRAAEFLKLCGPAP